MLEKISAIVNEFPRQFWIIVTGTFVNAVGGSMIFPFFTLYVSKRFNLPMTSVGLLFVAFTVIGIFAQGFGGAWADQFGRKKIMAASLGLSALGMLGFALADSLLTLFPVMTLFGFSNSLFSPASNAMIADLVGEEKRPRAYSFLRVSNNLGVAIGPAVGGFLAAISYLYSFSGAATASAIYFVIVLTLMRETLPALNPRPVVGSVIKARGGYEQVIRDVPFVVALALFILVQFTIAQMFTTLPVYMRNVYSLAEDKFGWVMTTNAAMVVLLQFWITRRVERWARLVVLALGALFYAIGVGAVALSSTFPAFILDMVIITIGEMLLFPAISALTADYAPEHLRGRYMGLFAIASGVGFGLGPVIGGAIFDQISPHSVWPLMALFGFTAALGYLVAARLFPPRAHVEAATP